VEQLDRLDDGWFRKELALEDRLAGRCIELRVSRLKARIPGRGGARYRRQRDRQSCGKSTSKDIATGGLHELSFPPGLILTL
jgi:hypothetical protein